MSSVGEGSEGVGDSGALGGRDVDVTHDQMTAAIGRLRTAAERFVVELRRNESLDPAALDELCEAIDSCGRGWRQETTVPKSAALILTELFPAVNACAWLYSESDPLRQRIQDAAARVAESVSASLDNPDGGLDPDL